MRAPTLAALLSIAAGTSLAWAQADKPPCPAGQANSSDGSCIQDMPATPHQEELLKGTGQHQPEATGAATGTTTGEPQGGEMPATPHQQDVVKDKPAG